MPTPSAFDPPLQHGREGLEIQQRLWFGIIERQAIRRGSFNSVRDLNAKIRAFVTGRNDRRHPFVWTKATDDILKKASRQTTSNTDH